MVPGIPLASQEEEILCGSTRGERELATRFPGSYWHDHYTDAKPVVFGHHVTGHEPMMRDGRIFGLDTGACHGWRLTALCLPELTVHSVQAHADHWSVARRQWQLPVLKARPWRDFTWPELTDAVARFSSAPDAATRSWLEAVEMWAADLQSSFPALSAAAHRVAVELTAGELRQHPAARLLFQARDGRLDHASLARQCPTPGKVIDMAAALGLAVPDVPD
jgi:serine/threonine protein phosphatase 1